MNKVKEKIERLYLQNAKRSEGITLVALIITVEEGIVPIYENKTKERLINARELHEKLRNKWKYSDWIKQRIEHYKFIENKDFITFHNFVKRGENSNLGKKLTEYYITIDMAKELCMVENNDIGRNIRRYFIETEKRYRQIMNNPQNIFDFMRLALNQIEENEKEIKTVKTIAFENKSEIEKLKSKIDIFLTKGWVSYGNILHD